MYSSRDNHKVTLLYNAEERHLLIQVHGYRIKVSIHNHPVHFFLYLFHNHPLQDQITATIAGSSLKFLQQGKLLQKTKFSRISQRNRIFLCFFL